MHSANFLLFSLPLLAYANPLQVTLTINDGKEDIIRPTWEQENSGLIVPLTSQARTGLVDPVLEEGLIAAVGPRFANAFYDNATASGTTFEIKCFTSCAGVIVKSLPCIFAAVTSGDIPAVLKCVGKDTLCGCASCLPDAIENFIDQNICNANVVDTIAAKDKFSPYVDFAAISDSSVDIAAFRGDLKTFQVEQIRALNVGCSVAGSSCGGCDCCVGGCIFDTCIGVCA